MEEFYRLTDWLENFWTGLYNPIRVTLEVIGLIILSVLVIKIGSYLIRKIFEKQKKFKYNKYNIDEKKINTMATLLVSVYRYAVYIIAGVTILSDIFKLKSILAAAGIGGIAVGFGAQSLIRDVISGFFIVLEDQFAVGDLVTIEDMTGTVEQMELRVTKLRNFNGDLYIIPNGQIGKVINHTRGNKAVIVDIPIAYSTDINRAVDLAEKVCACVVNEFDTIVEVPRVLGVTELGRENLNLRIFAKTIPNAQWEVERRIRKLIKEEFENGKILFYDRNRIILNEGSEKGGDLNGGQV